MAKLVESRGSQIVELFHILYDLFSKSIISDFIEIS